MKIERPRLLEIIKEEIDWARTRIPQKTISEGEGTDQLIRKHQNDAKGAAMALLDPKMGPHVLKGFVQKNANIVVDAMVEIEKLLDENVQAASPLQEVLQADTITRLENLLKDLSDEGSSLVGVLGTLIDQIKKDEGLQEQGEQLPELEELIDGYVEMWNAVHGPMPPALEQATRQGLSLLEPDKVGELAISMGTSTPENTDAMVADFKKRYGINVSENSWARLARVLQEVEIDPKTGKYPPPPEIPDVPSIPENLQFNVIDFLETIAGLKLKGSDIISREASKLLAKIEGGIK